MERNMEETGRFPMTAVGISLGVAAVLFVLGGWLMKNRSSTDAKCAGIAALLGNYGMAQDFLSEIDPETEASCYNEAVYRIASAMLFRGDYDAAAEKFVALGDYSDSRSRNYECMRGKAEALMKKGDYHTAGEIVKDILFFEGCEALYQECQFHNAQELIDRGEWMLGVKMLWNIKEYPDAKALAEKTALAHTGSADVQQMIGDGFSVDPEIMESYLRLTENRKRLRQGAVAVGFYHTVGVKQDGQVVSCGSNSVGQCDTGAWQNVTQVAAGAYHTVALHEDGTVTACGDNTYGQCDVKNWKNVVQVAASYYNTAGLLSDGTVVTCGYHEWTKAKNWSRIEHISCGAYALCGIAVNGELYTTHPSCSMEGQLTDADASVAFAVGLDYGGNVVCSSGNPGEWTEAVAVFAGGETVGVITPDFIPSVFHRRKSGYYDLPQEQPAVCMALGSTHLAVLYEDGSVYCAGDNGKGQCDTENWNLLA